MAENCGNCGRALGALEQARVFGGHVVCVECDRLLRSQQDPAPAQVIPEYATATSPQRTAGRPQQIELTAKRWKAMEVLGAVIFIPCLFLTIICLLQYRESESTRVLIVAIGAGFVTGCGVVLYVWARVGAWWHHG